MTTKNDGSELTGDRLRRLILGMLPQSRALVDDVHRRGLLSYADGEPAGWIESAVSALTMDAKEDLLMQLTTEALQIKRAQAEALERQTARAVRRAKEGRLPR